MEGFLRAAAASPRLRPADAYGNTEEILRLMRRARERNVKLLIFPELSITGYTAGDLFTQDSLLTASLDCLKRLIKESCGMDMLISVGLPYRYGGLLYDVSAVFMEGRLLGLVPKALLSSGRESSEARYFAGGSLDVRSLRFDMEMSEVPFGAGIIFECGSMPGFSLCVDSWREQETGPGAGDVLSLLGASVIAVPGASSETYGKAAKRSTVLSERSRRLCCGLVAAFSGPGESTTDLVFGGQRIISELGELLSDSGVFSDEELSIAELDICRIAAERNDQGTARASSMAFMGLSERKAYTVTFSYRENGADSLERRIDSSPFTSFVSDKRQMSREILDIQAHALIKRFEHTGSKKAVIGLSGGLDSTLALLALRHAFRLMERPMRDIICVTMPCFGTTDRTYDNACRLAREIGAELREINISQSVLMHFSDIGHDAGDRNSAYENAQARERTQILMDIANDVGGLDIGTGDLSEEALGWCTFGGDHMANYAVNTSIPKTLTRVIVEETAAAEENPSIAAVLRDILDTPVSPELLPSDESGNISQKTEDIVGPYELHDFFIWYMIRYGMTPKRIYELACRAFSGRYEGQEIRKWLRLFYGRFFSQQFKRSTALDGPKVSEVDLSPRGGYMMPSDAVNEVWLRELSELSDAD